MYKAFHKNNSKYKLQKTIGKGRTAEEMEFLYRSARQYIQEQQGTINLFVNRDDSLIESCRIII